MVRAHFRSSCRQIVWSKMEQQAQPSRKGDPVTEAQRMLPNGSLPYIIDSYERLRMGFSACSPSTRDRTCISSMGNVLIALDQSSKGVQ